MATLMVMPTIVTSCNDENSEISKELNSDENSNDENSENSKDPNNEETAKLIGSWVGYDGTPGLEWTTKYVLTFYSNGRATEKWTCDGESDTCTGTYKYSNGKITEFLKEEGSVLEQAIGPCPWTVSFSSSTSMTITTSVFEMTFDKQ